MPLNEVEESLTFRDDLSLEELVRHLRIGDNEEFEVCGLTLSGIPWCTTVGRAPETDPSSPYSIKASESLVRYPVKLLTAIRMYSAQ